MPRTGMRFRPPRVDWTPELRWVLLRAFGPTDRPAPADIDGAQAAALARRLDLAPRIGLRVPFATLAAELGTEEARWLAIDSVNAEAVAERLRSFARFIAEVAAAESLPVVFLKGVALHLAGIAMPGARSIGDVDVLAGGDRAGELQAALVRRGLHEDDVPGSEHQLCPVHTPAGEVAEVHRRILGFRTVGKASWARLEDLDAAGLLVRAADLPGESYLPSLDALLAHALVHGIAQHGLSPGSYPALRMFADVADLLAADLGEAGFAGAHALIADEVSAAEVEATREAVVALCAGDERCCSRAWGESPAGIMLRHAVAGGLDPDYGRSLRLVAVMSLPSELPRPLAWLREAWHSLVLTRSQIDVIYGPQRSRVGYAWRRLLRPFDLLWRLARSFAAAVACRLRGAASSNDPPR